MQDDTTNNSQSTPLRSDDQSSAGQAVDPSTSSGPSDSQTDDTPVINAPEEATEEKVTEVTNESEGSKGTKGTEVVEDANEVKEDTEIPTEPFDVIANDNEAISTKTEDNEKIATSSQDSTRNDDKSPTEEIIPVAEEPETMPAPKASDPKGAHWYVVHTYSGHEQKVAATLRQRVESQKLADKILDILVPTQEKIEIKEGKKATIKEKIFPGYLLIRMVLDDNTWLAVRTTPGITSFVGNANKPTPLPEDEVEGIKKFMAMEAPKFKTTFSIGEAVRITDGPFSEFLGSINEIDEEKGKLKVMVSIFGRETPVELDFLQVAKL